MKKVKIRNDLIISSREGLGWSRQELADKAKIGRQNIYNAEWGKGISIDTLAKIAEALGTPIAELIEAPAKEE